MTTIYFKIDTQNNKIYCDGKEIRRIESVKNFINNANDNEIIICNINEKEVDLSSFLKELDKIQNG